MFGQWGFFLAAGKVPEIHTEPLRIGFHLAGELLTALTLLVSGVGLSKIWAWSKPLSVVALGMVLYTVIVSPGYFAQQGRWALVAIFAGLFIFTLLSVANLWRDK